MNKFQEFMLKHPYISIAVIMPFALAFVLGVFSILLNIVFPILVSAWLAGWIYTAIVGKSVNKYYHRPFWYIRYDWRISVSLGFIRLEYRAFETTLSGSFDGFNTVYKFVSSTDSHLRLFQDNYKTEEAPFFNASL